VPVLQGTNANEGRLFEPDLILESSLNAAAVDAAGGPANFDLNHVNAFCTANGIDEKCTFPQEINLFLNELGVSSSTNSSSFDSMIAGDYPLSNFPDPFLANNAPSADEALSQVFTDLVFSCNGLDSNGFLSQFVTVYAYEFNDPNAPPSTGSDTAIKAPNDVDGFPSASEHASELPFLFVETGTTFNLSSAEETLSAQMQTYWGNFVVNLNPNTAASANSESVADWPVFTAGSPTLQNLVPGGNVAPFTSFATEHFCNTWEPIIEAEGQE
jgi:para-nitrobenzyl esterase